MADTLYYTIIPYACFGVVVSTNGIIIETAPIAKWMIGKHINEIKLWVNKKSGKIARCNNG
jgi:hypothetical protein